MIEKALAELEALDVRRANTRAWIEALIVEITTRIGAMPDHGPSIASLLNRLEIATREGARWQTSQVDRLLTIGLRQATKSRRADAIEKWLEDTQAVDSEITAAYRGRLERVKDRLTCGAEDAAALQARLQGIFVRAISRD